MAIANWKITQITYEQIPTPARVEGCGWCSNAFGRGYPVVRIEDRGTGETRIVHKHCLEPLQRRARIAEIVRVLGRDVESYEKTQRELEGAWEGDREPSPGFYESRDDAAVAVAQYVPELLELLKGEGLAQGPM